VLLTACQVLLVLCAALVVHLCCLAVVHPYAAQLAPVHGVGLPSLQRQQQQTESMQNMQQSAGVAVLAGRGHGHQRCMCCVMRSNLQGKASAATKRNVAAEWTAQTVDRGLTSVMVALLRLKEGLQHGRMQTRKQLCSCCCRAGC
jgi:hypothetical protein